MGLAVEVVVGLDPVETVDDVAATTAGCVDPVYV